MTKRLSIIALIISICAVLCGLFFVDVDGFMYEWQNGPPLVTPGFEERIRNANIFDINFYKNYKITSGAYGEDSKSLWRPGFTLFNQINSNEKDLLIVSEFTNSQCQLQIPRYEIRDKGWHLKKSSKETFSGLVSIKKLNRIIDSQVFPDPKTRKQKKEELLKRIDELNKQARAESKLVPGRKTQQENGPFLDKN